MKTLDKLEKVFRTMFIVGLLLMALALSLPFFGYAKAEEIILVDGTDGTAVVEVNYMELIVQAASNVNYSDGEYYATQRNAKIVANNMPYEQFTFSDFMLLSKIITNEAGSYWLTMEHRMCVGNVALNRVASPEFPNTLLEVIEQPSQYVGKGNRAFAKLKPYSWCCEAAARLYNGERPLPKSVVFQANFKQGSGIFLKVKDPTGALKDTYFCYSSRMDLYKE